MNRIEKFKDIMSHNTRAIKIGIAATAVIGTAYCFASYAPIASVGSKKITYRDVYGLSGTITELMNITGTKTTGSPRLNAFQTFLVTAAEQEILNAEKIRINQEPATQILMNSTPFRGVLDTRRKALSEERFYRLYVEPTATGEVFTQYYNARDPKRKQAAAILEQARTSGVAAAGQQAGIQPQEITVARSTDSAPLFEAARSHGAGQVIDRLIEDGGGFSIAQIKSMEDKSLVLNSLYIPRTPIGDFIKSKLAEFKIPLTVTPYSLYRLSELSLPGMVFAPQKEEKNSATPAKP